MRSIKILALAALIFMPLSAKACDVRPYAKSYIESINNVFGGTKPKLIVEKGNNEEIAAFYDGTAIHIYKRDYKGNCADEIPYLKSVIAHEYAHHAAAKLRPFTKLRGEDLAYLAEHAIGDAILGDDVEYDNDEDLDHPTAYIALKNMILQKQIIRNVQTNSQTTYFKYRR